MLNTRIKELILKSTFGQRLTAGGIILISAAFLLYALMLAPYAAYFNSLRGELTAQRKLLNLKLGRSGDLAKRNQEYLAGQKKLQEVNKRFFTEGESEAFMKQLPRIAAGFGNRVVLLEPRSKDRTLGLRRIDLEAAMAGQFEGILALLNWFDKYDKIIGLEKISIITNAQTSGIETRFTLGMHVIE